MLEDTASAALSGIRLDIPRLRRLGRVAVCDPRRADRTLADVLSDRRAMMRIGAMPAPSRSLELFRVYAARLEAEAGRGSNIHAFRPHLRPRNDAACAARLWSLPWLERIMVALTRLDTFTTAEAMYILERPRTVLEGALDRAFFRLDPQTEPDDPVSAQANDQG